MRYHLIKNSKNNRVYQTGMDIILQQGFKSFLNKFKRKGYRLNHYEQPQGIATRSLSDFETNCANRELVYLLSEMIQAVGTYHGAE